MNPGISRGVVDEGFEPRRSSPVRVLVLGAALGALGTGAAGCSTKSCDVHDIDSSVTSTLSYTEPEAAHQQRMARLQAGTEGPEVLSGDRARGTDRVVDEARTFDNSVSAYASVTLTSTVESTFVFEQMTLAFPVSVVRLTFDRPAQRGTFSLAELHATICESVQFPPAAHARSDGGPDNADAAESGTGAEGGVPDGSFEGGAPPEGWTQVCADAGGTLEFAPSGSSAFDADLALSPIGAGDAPSISGSAHVHYEEVVQRGSCPDLGGVGLSP